MVWSHLLRFLLISTVLALCFSQGICGRELMGMGYEKQDSDFLLQDLERNKEKGRRVLIQVMDYSDPEPNPRNGRFLPPP